MARMRSVKPEFWTDRKLARLSRDARLLYIALWNQADEWGRLHGDSRYVKGHCLPYDDDLSLAAIDGLLRELEGAGRVIRYDVDGDPFMYLPKLDQHQRLEPAKVPSRLPEPPSSGHTPPDAPSSAPRADEAARDSDTFADGATSSETIAAKHVAGGMEHVAGSRLQVAREARITFDDFWSVYPLKTAKKAAAKAWPRAIRDADPFLILAGAVRYREDPNRDPGFTAHPASWLNAGRWDDEPLPERSLRAVPSRTSEQDATLRRWHDQAITGQLPELGA